MPVVPLHITRERFGTLNTQLWNQHCSKPLVIGFHAPKGTGKDTLATALEELAVRQELFEPHVSGIAGPLYEAVSAITGKPVAWLMDQANKNRPFTEADTPVSTLWGKTPRSILENVGTLIRDTVDPRHWTHLKCGLIAEKLNQGIILHYLTDIRFKEECAICDVVFELRRNGIEYGGESDHVSTRRLPAEFITDTIWLDAYDRTPEAYRQIYERIHTTALYVTRNRTVRTGDGEITEWSGIRFTGVIAPEDRPAFVRANVKHTGVDIGVITCPACKQTVVYTSDDFPIVTTPCPCGAPRRFLVKWDDAPA